MEHYQSCHSTTNETDIRKMQRILDTLLSEIVDKQQTSGGDVLALTRESQSRLMNYKELYLHRELIGEEELQTRYNNMSETEKVIADEGVDALTYMIQALDES